MFHLFYNVSWSLFGHFARRRGENLQRLITSGSAEGRRSRARNSLGISTADNVSFRDSLRAAEDRSK